MRWIIHIDMDAFFAAVEQKRRPELAGKPVVVGGRGDPSGRGVVASASYEARKFGIHSAMPLTKARKLCPDTVFLPVDFEEYRRESEKVKAVLRRFSPRMEDVGIDEAYIELSLEEMHPETVAEELKRSIREETELTCSIGIGPNKLLAKTASDMEKPDGLVMIAAGDIEALFWPLPVKKLRGVGPKTEARLKKIRIITIGDLAALPRRQLTGLFGKSQGNYLHRASRGIDDSMVVTVREPKSLSRETTFQKDVGRDQVIRLTLARLTKNVVHRMREKGLRARSITVKVRYSDFTTHTRGVTFSQATDSLFLLRKAALECLERFRLNRKVRLIGLRLGNLEAAGKPLQDSGPKGTLL